MREQQTELSHGRLADCGKLTVGQWLDQWITLVQPSVSNNSWAFYDYHVRKTLRPELGGVPLGRLTTARIEKLYADLLKTGASVDALEIQSGLSPGDEIILSDTSRYANVDSLRVD